MATYFLLRRFEIMVITIILLMISLSCYAQSPLFDSDFCCPICQDDWVPLPLDINESWRVKTIDDTHKPQLLWEIKKSNISNSIKVINSSHGMLCITTDGYDGTGIFLFATMGKVDKNKIIFLNLSLPEYELTESDVQWLLSLSNLQSLSLRVKNTPVSFLMNIKKLNRLQKLECILNDSKELSQHFLEAITGHNSIESLVMHKVVFSDTYKWSLPQKTSVVEVNLSHLTSDAIKILGRAKHVKHLVLINSEFPECSENATNYFHSQLRCVLIHNKAFSRCLINSLDNYRDLKMLFIRIDNNTQFIEDKISETKNILRVLIVDNDAINEVTDQFLKGLRRKYAIYADYDVNWFRYNRDYAESCFDKKPIHPGLFRISAIKKLNYFIKDDKVK